MILGDLHFDPNNVLGAPGGIIKTRHFKQAGDIEGIGGADFIKFFTLVKVIIAPGQRQPALPNVSHVTGAVTKIRKYGGSQWGIHTGITGAAKCPHQVGRVFNRTDFFEIGF